jgi:hypothetical protein
MLYMFEQSFKSIFSLSDNLNKSIRILEIGAGYSGLCGIALAYWIEKTMLTHPSHFENVLSIEIILTDGVNLCVDKI